MDPILSLLEELVAAVEPLDSGEPAQYIPELADVDPDRLALAIVGPRGRVISIGDDRDEFTIQSVSKPFVLAAALQELGRDEVLTRVGVEPSGEPFNAISLDAETGRPANPLINAGAIATTALIPGADVDERTAHVVDTLSRFAGRSLWVDEAVYRSESETGDRNRALAHLMRSTGVIVGEVTPVVETYFRQCAILVTVRDLAVMAATLAFGGRNPVTGEQVVAEHVARDVTSVMSSCGMYDYSGEWMLRVGLPAKSGVSGALLALAPSQFGIAAFSPRLDAHGTSVRAAQLVERLSTTFGMHTFEPHESIAEPGIQVQREDDGGILITLGGELAFSGTERVLTTLREVVSGALSDVEVTVDARELARAHPAALAVLRAEFAVLPGRVHVLA